jgi:HAD superfamily hydrolase (TIGR01549 family)
MQLGVLLDLDGTLAHADGWGEWLAELREALGVPSPSAAPFDAALTRAVGGDGALTLATACRAALAGTPRRSEGAGAPPLEVVVAEATRSYARRARLLPGASELLDDLEALALPYAIVTNGPVDLQRAVVERLGLAQRARAVIVSGAPDVAVRKPHPKVFWLACTALGVQPGDALMVGDDLHADIRGAHRFGAATCWIAPDGAAALDAPPATSVVGSLSEAAEVVRAFALH